MKCVGILIFYCAAVLCCVNAKHVQADYNVNNESDNGAQLLSIECYTDEKAKLVLQFKDRAGFDFIKTPRHEPFEILVSGDEIAKFEQILNDNGIRYTNLTGQRVKRAVFRSKPRKDSGPDYSYPSYESYESMLINISKSYSNFVELLNLGLSSEGRNIHGLKISTSNVNNPYNSAKPAIFIDGGMHAREWISPSTALFLSIALAKAASQNNPLVRGVDFYIVPLLNPDGYAFSQSAPEHRLWRKTRSNNTESHCIGVDLNRNFDIGWDEGSHVSTEPCDSTYKGSMPFSEPEAQHLKNFLSQDRNIKIYLTLHSYGQMLLYPWGYSTEVPSGAETMHCVAEKAARAIAQVRGTRYKVGSSGTLLYTAGGGSDDWALFNAGVELSYTMELPGGIYGFRLPFSETTNVGFETLEAIKVFVDYLQNKSTCRRILPFQMEERKNYQSRDSWSW